MSSPEKAGLVENAEQPARAFRYAIKVEYDGTPYVGWQRQADRMSVQQRIEEAIVAFSGEQVSVQASGRTDAGVHAFGQVVHLDLSKDWDAFRIQQAMNYHLKPDPIAIVACAAVSLDFEARFSALKRHYLYRILNRRARPALSENKVWHVPQQLDASAMHDSAQFLVGHHDFTAFRDAECQAKSPMRSLDEIAVKMVEDEVHVACHARSFLHHQVRSIVGTLKNVGTGKIPPQEVGEILRSRDRARCGALAPASGLYFVRADYEPDPFD